MMVAVGRMEDSGMVLLQDMVVLPDMAVVAHHLDVTGVEVAFQAMDAGVVALAVAVRIEDDINPDHDTSRKQKIIIIEGKIESKAS